MGELKLKRYKLHWLLLVLAVASLPGCTAFQESVDVAAGQEALWILNYPKALMEFEKAVKLEPNHVDTSTEFSENVYTYLGQSYYGLGDLQKARAALEQSVARHPNGIMGNLYLGIVELRLGQTQAGFKRAEKGLTLFNNWWKTLDATDSNSCYWDPGDWLRNHTKSLLAQVKRRDPTQIASRMDRLGLRMTQEIRWTTRDISEGRGDSCG